MFFYFTLDVKNRLTWFYIRSYLELFFDMQTLRIFG